MPRTSGGMWRGIWPYIEGEWRWHDFEGHDEAILHAAQFCYDCLLNYARALNGDCADNRCWRRCPTVSEGQGAAGPAALAIGA
jgi:hypothetical protein